MGKLMRYELVKELQNAGPDVEVECTGDPEELTELKIKDEVWVTRGSLVSLACRLARTAGRNCVWRDGGQQAWPDACAALLASQ